MSALHVACILEQETYKPGDQAPEGYLAWHEWADVQHKAGLRQKQCGRCGLWRYPQQLSATVDRTELTGLRKRQPFRRTLETPVCNDCNKTPNVRANLPAARAAGVTMNEQTDESQASAGQVERPVRRHWVRNYRCNNKECCDGAWPIQVAHTTDTKEHWCAWCGQKCAYEADVCVCDAQRPA